MMVKAAAVPQSATAITASMTIVVIVAVTEAVRPAMFRAPKAAVQIFLTTPIQTTSVAFIHVMAVALAKATAQQMMIATATAVIIVMSATVA